MGAGVRYLYIAGKWTEAADGGTSQTINPYDASPLDTLAEAGPADVDAAVAAAREAFDAGPWRRSTVTDRAALLGKIADLLQRDREQLAHTESLDTGKTLNEARADVDDTTAVFRYYAGIAGDHAGRVVDPGRPSVTSRITHEPVGVCALIAPWNYPLLQISWKLAPGAGRGQHDRDQAQRADAAVHGGPGRAVRGGRHPARRAEPAARPGRHGGAGAGRSSCCGPDFLHRRAGDRGEHHGHGGARGAARRARARRQEPEHRVRRHRLQHGRGQRTDRCVPAFRPGVFGRLAG